MREKPQGYRPKPLSEMDNPGGIGAAIKARESKLGDAKEMLATGQNANGAQLTPNKRSRLRHTIRTLEAELAVLYERRAYVASLDTPFPGNATAQRAPFSNVSDWE